MVEIISKRNGPDRKERQFRHLIDKNRATIERLADHLTQGTWSARPKLSAPTDIQERSRTFAFMPTSSEAQIEPHIRISPNDRVVLMDASSGRQLALLGQIRGGREERRFALATAANGFVCPLEGEMAERLEDLDGTGVNGIAGEETFAQTLRGRLGLRLEQRDSDD